MQNLTEHKASLSRVSFALVTVAVIVGPWLFGAWEMWWFWPLAACIALASLLFALRLPQAEPVRVEESDPAEREGRRRKGRRLRNVALAGCLPFLLYAALRTLHAGVYMDAERSLLLFLLPLLLAVQIVYGFTRGQARLLYGIVAVNLVLLGGYGLVNHFLTGSKLVLWAPGYPQYIIETRATGSYFCPDHFAGIMELMLCIALGVILDRASRWSWRFQAACVAGMALAGVILSKSRGGGLTVVVVAAATLVWGFVQRPPLARWCCRLAAVCAMGIALIVFCHYGEVYLQRFASFFNVREAREKPWPEMVETVKKKVINSSRGRMIPAALRSWRTAPWFGIGPGMHQNVWQHFAPTPDGDPQTGRWPSQLNNQFHSYEVHSDWVQLLQEYGLAGTLLLIGAFGCVAAVPLAGLQREAGDRRRRGWERNQKNYFAMNLAALLCLVAMTFHSLGDFNLQMPATTWVLAVLVAVPVKLTTEPLTRRGRRHK